MIKKKMNRYGSVNKLPWPILFSYTDIFLERMKSTTTLRIVGLIGVRTAYFRR